MFIFLSAGSCRRHMPAHCPMPMWYRKSEVRANGLYKPVHKIIHIMISDFLCYLYYLLISPKQKLCRPFHPVIVQIILKGLSVFFSEKLP